MTLSLTKMVVKGFGTRLGIRTMDLLIPSLKRLLLDHWDPFLKLTWLEKGSKLNVFKRAPGFKLVTNKLRLKNRG